MEQVTLEAKVLTLEAAVSALAKTNTDKAKALMDFNSHWQESVRAANKSSNEQLAKAIQAEVNRLSFYFK